MDYENILQKIYETILEEGDNVIDVGAHVGRHTIPIAKKINPSGKVYAVEPLPMCQSILQNLLIESQKGFTDNIILLPYALSDFEGVSKYSIVVDDLGYSGLKERRLDNKSSIKKIDVQVRKLDNLFQGLNALKYIKIDAEGGEFNILKGGINIIKKFRPFVSFEFGESSYSSYSIIPEEVYFYWKELNYDIYDVLGNRISNEQKFAESAKKTNSLGLHSNSC